MAIKKSELYSSLWKSCFELRGGMDASQYRDCVLVLPFVKYGSDNWLARLATDVQSVLDRVSQALTGRIGQLAECYATPLPTRAAEVETLAARMDADPKRMGFQP